MTVVAIILKIAVVIFSMTTAAVVVVAVTAAAAAAKLLLLLFSIEMAAVPFVDTNIVSSSACCCLGRNKFIKFEEKDIASETILEMKLPIVFTIVLELFILCEKRSTDAFMFKSLLQLVVDFSEGKKDFYQVVGYSKRV